ncbi:hypothetical protein ACFSTD_08785 [Novosphingobium colocasiae]
MRISWALDDGQFRIGWIEAGGPAVAPPQRKGFGSRIMVDVPRVKLSAQVTVDYPREGFRWTLTCGADALD